MSSRLADWAEVSPEVITTSDRDPRLPHSWATSSTAAAGTVTTARSGASGSAARLGTQGMPSMSSRCGFTACRVPVNPASRMLSRMDRPIEPGRWPAPTTATERGANSGSRLATSARCSRPATASRYVLGSLSPALPGMGMLSSITPSSSRRVTASPASANTRSMAVFSGSVEAVRTRTPRSRASETRCSSSRVATPRRCIRSATANATSAVSGSASGSKLATPTSSSPRKPSIAPWADPSSPRHTRRASCSAAWRLMLKKRR